MCSKEHRLTEAEQRDPASHFTTDSAKLSLGGRGKCLFCAEKK